MLPTNNSNYGIFLIMTLSGSSNSEDGELGERVKTYKKWFRCKKQSVGQTVNRCEAVTHSGCRLDDVSHDAC